jgi:hypothetical protein
MIRILIYSPALTQHVESFPAQVVAFAFSRFRRPIPFGYTSPRLFPVSPQAPRREHQAAPGGTAGFCFPGLLPQSKCGSPFPKSSPGHLGAAIPRVRPG